MTHVDQRSSVFTNALRNAIHYLSPPSMFVSMSRARLPIIIIIIIIIRLYVCIISRVSFTNIHAPLTFNLIAGGYFPISTQLNITIVSAMKLKYYIVLQFLIYKLVHCIVWYILSSSKNHWSAIYKIYIYIYIHTRSVHSIEHTNLVIENTCPHSFSHHTSIM